VTARSEGKEVSATFEEREEDRRALLKKIVKEVETTSAQTGRKTLAPRLLAALAKVRREAFVRESEAALAYVDTALPIGHGQTISQPFIVAIMTELLDLGPDEAVLEIGTGSGYQAAVLAELARKVYSVEIVPALAERAQITLAAEGYHNIEIRCGDGGTGWPEHAPYDAVIVTAATPEIPRALIHQLKPNGRMIVPIGPRYGMQQLLLVRKDAAGNLTQRGILSVVFVPLRTAV